MQHSYCQIHSSSPQTLSLICLYKSCPSNFTPCCNSCKNQLHKQHAARVVSLSEFYKNINLVRSDLNKKLKICAIDNEYHQVMANIKSIRRFRLSILNIESKLLLSALELQKQHKQHISTQSNLISALEFLNTNRNNQQTINTKLKELSGVLDYNYTKMKLEVNETKNRKVRQGKERIINEVQKQRGELKQYMIKILDVVLRDKSEKTEDYNVEEFKQHLNESILALETEIKQSSRQLKSLQSKAITLEYYLEQPFNAEEENNDNFKLSEAMINDEQCGDPSLLSRDVSVTDKLRSSVSMIHYETGTEDNKSIACSIDFSRCQFQGRAKIKERMIIQRGKIVLLEEQNRRLKKQKDELEIELVSSSNKLATLVKEIDGEKNDCLKRDQQNKHPNNNRRKMRIRVLQHILILPTINEYKQKYEEILGLYNEVVSQFIVLKDKNFLSTKANSNFDDENKRLKKKNIQLQKQCSMHKKEIEVKDKSIVNMKEDMEKIEAQMSISKAKSVNLEQYQTKISNIQSLLKQTQKQKQVIQKKLKQISKEKLKYQSQSKKQQIDFAALKKDNQLLNIKQTQNETKISQLKQMIGNNNSELSEFESLVVILQRQKKQLSQHSQVLRDQSLKQIQRIRQLENEEENYKNDINIHLGVIKELKESSLTSQKTIKQLKDKIKEQDELHIQQKQNMEKILFKNLSKKKEEGDEQKLKAALCSKDSEIVSLKKFIQEEHKQEKQKREKYRVKIEELQSALNQYIMKHKLLETQNRQISNKLNEYMQQLSLAKQQSIQKSSKITELSNRINAVERQQYQTKGDEYSKAKFEALTIQNKKSQAELVDEKNKNQRLNSYINDLEQRIGTVQSKISDKSKQKPKSEDLDKTVATLKNDVSVLEGKIKDKELIQKIYIKELDTKKQELLKLSRENEMLRGTTLKKDIFKGVIEKEKEKENRGLRKYLSFGEH